MRHAWISAAALTLLVLALPAAADWPAGGKVVGQAGDQVFGDKIIIDIRMGRAPKGLTRDERAIYDFVKELHKTKRVSDRNYKRVHAIVGDAGMVEFVGICGYYVLVAMTLNVFRMPPPAGAPMPFREP